VQPVSKYVERAPSKDPVALDNQRALTEFVIEFMAGHSGFTREQLLEGRKLAHVSRARTLTQYILYRHVKLSYNGVARAMNRLDHTTAMHAVKRIEAAIKQNPGYAKSIDNLIQQIKEKWET
jgi:chromosomal replication initiator protein